MTWFWILLCSQNPTSSRIWHLAHPLRYMKGDISQRGVMNHDSLRDEYREEPRPWSLTCWMLGAVYQSVPVRPSRCDLVYLGWTSQRHRSQPPWKTFSPLSAWFHLPLSSVQLIAAIVCACPKEPWCSIPLWAFGLMVLSEEQPCEGRLSMGRVAWVLLGLSNTPAAPFVPWVVRICTLLASIHCKCGCFSLSTVFHDKSILFWCPLNDIQCFLNSVFIIAWSLSFPWSLLLNIILCIIQCSKSWT